MQRRLTAVLIGGLVASALVAPSAQAEPSHTADLLGQSRHGAAAVTALGDDLDIAARRNDMRPGELRRLLLHDRTAWIDPNGRVLYRDPVPRRAPREAGRSGHLAQAPYPYEQTFALHSAPDSDRVLYLDFDGGVVQGTVWNFLNGLSTDPQPAWSIDGNATTFSETERDLVQGVWQRVAEDYAPFDVDVTTEDPGQDALRRTSEEDLEFGVRVLITPSFSARSSVCSNQCAGVAYIGTYGQPGNYFYDPAWVFPQVLFDNEKYIAEAVSHEAGHTLALQHDGRGAAAYDEGHGAWAPIMGVGYYRPITQWSQGEYAGATNTQDDLAVITANVGRLRPDDHGATDWTAPALGAGSHLVANGAITNRSDTDWFRLGLDCSDEVTIQAHPATRSPNLDIALRLRAANGDLVWESNPASVGVDYDGAGGLSSGIVRTVEAGSYFIEVDGVGVHDPVTDGYSDYASVGTYQLTVDGCGATPPSEPQDVTINGDGETARAGLAWTPPATAGSSPVTGYQVAVDGARLRSLGPAARQTSYGNISPEEEHTLSVRAVTRQGVSTVVDRTITLPRPAPGQPSGAGATAGDGRATITWTAPSNAFAAGIDGYRVQTYAGSATTPVAQEFTNGSTFSWTQTGLTNGQPYSFDVTALHGTTMGPLSARTAEVMPLAAPGPPTDVHHDSGRRRANRDAALGGAGGHRRLGHHGIPGDRRRRRLRGQPESGSDQTVGDVHQPALQHRADLLDHRLERPRQRPGSRAHRHPRR